MSTSRTFACFIVRKDADGRVDGRVESISVEDLPPGVRLGNNLTAFRGGMRLWALESIHTHAAGVADAPLPEAQPREWCVI